MAFTTLRSFTFLAVRIAAKYAGVIILFAFTGCSKNQQLDALKPVPGFSLPKRADSSRFVIVHPVSNLVLGANGHPLSSDPYINTSSNAQIALLKSLGMHYYKFDVNVLSTGSVSVPYLFTPLINVALSNGIRLIPTLNTPTLNLSASEGTSYQSGKLLGSAFAKWYAPYITYYVLGNELDNKIIRPGVVGDKVSDYNITAFKSVAAYLKGMDEGIKLVDPVAQTMIDASWLHYQYLQMLQSYGVKFDIVAYHWYSDMEMAASKSPYNIPDITLKLSGIFTKPIWFTEVGQRFTTAATYEYDQDQYLQEFITKCRKNARVHAVLIYELFDEPQKTNALERNYGLASWLQPYTNWRLKEAGVHLLIN